MTDGPSYAFVQKKLHIPVICDILDTLGYGNQAMAHRLRPLVPDILNCGFIGRARTLRWMEVDYIVDEDPYGLEIEALDSLEPGDVVVHSTELGCNCAPWGELMTNVAKKNGAVGCICDNGIRDCARIIELNFPVYYSAITPLDSKGRAKVMAYDVPVKCGGVLVNPGDLIFADYDGIVVIPRQIEADVIKLAKEKVDKESLARRDILQGKTLREVFNTYRVL